MRYLIYGAPGSGSGIVEAACAEIGADYDVRDLDARNDEHRGEAYGEINPHRKMPAIATDGGEIITESVAIVLTLDERHPEARLLPAAGSKERAQALRWMVFMAAEMYPLVEMIDYPERFAPSPDEAAALRRRADEILLERWLLVEKAVAGTPYFLASGFSALDLFVTKFSGWLDPEWRRDNLPRVDDLTAAVFARPALAPVWARHVR
ncbi:MAG: glutathione S-transferase family protein [Holophagae bacterium]|jgi:glutathione S-transferase